MATHPVFMNLALVRLKQLFSQRSLSAWFTFSVCLLLTLLLSEMFQRQQDRAINAQFQQHVNELVNALEERLQDHEQILLGGKGLFNASEQVSRDEWQTYITSLQLEKNYPGILGVGFSQVFLPHQFEQHEQRIKSEGFAEYKVYPFGQRDIYTAIIYLEPFTGRNLAAFGYDMYSEPTRRKAMSHAATTGETSISAKVKLVQETHGPEQAGFLMYLPVYRKNSVLSDPEQRFQALEGFVYSPYRVNDLMRGILGQNELLIDFSLYDGEAADADALMYSSATYHLPEEPVVQFNALRQIHAYGHVWTVLLVARPGLLANYSTTLPSSILLMGSAISVLLFFLIHVLLYRRENALLLAAEMVRRRDESEERFMQLFMTVGQGIVIYDAAGEIIAANPAAEIILGAALAQLRGQHALDPCWRMQDEDGKVLPDEQNPVLTSLRDDKPVQDVVLRVMHQTKNEFIWIQLSVYPRREMGSTENVVAYVLISDITQRKLAEINLLEQAQHTQAILDNMVDGLIVISHSGIINSINPAAKRIFGYSNEEMLGKNVRMLMPDPHREAHDSYLPNYQATGIASVIGMDRELEGLRKSGEKFPLELAVSAISKGGAPFYVGMVRDITERKQTERIKKEFVSTVSHELRTPLTSLCGALDLVASGTLGPLNDATQQLILLAQSNGQRLKFLINDLLDLEKLSQGKLEFDLQVQPLQPLLQQAADNLKTYGLERHIDIALELPAEELLVRVDGQRLQQVLANLLSNAIKFSPQNSSVRLQVQQQDDKVRVSVADNGPGVPGAFKSRIFERFSQADSSDSRNVGGTGLGLAICREIIIQMGGIISFDSVEGQGATFWFELPLR